MSLSQWFRPPRHLLALFLAVTLVLASALGWLSWRWLQQDRSLESQRLQERVEHTADLAGAALLRSFSEIDRQLTDLAVLPASQLDVAASQNAKQLAENALIVVLHTRGVEAYPNNGLLYYPLLPAPKEPPASVFAAGEILEFQRPDPAGAMAAFRPMARSPDPAIRAGALLRLGRNLRKTRQLSAALAVYEELARLGSTPAGGLPAELLARHARCSLLEELKRTAELQGEARSLYLDLQRGRWQLARSAYRFYAEEALRWFPTEGGGPSGIHAHEQDALALAAAVESLWEEWQRIRRGEGNSAGRRSLWLNDRSVLLLWRSTPERLVALVAGPRYFERQALESLRALAERQGVRVALADSEGRQVLGQPAGPATRQAVRTAAETQLPWTLHVISADPRADLAELAGRRRLLLAALAIMATLVLVGSYLIARAVTRELEVAHLKSDFVAAVSHEFRTPLTSLRQLTELLARGRVPGEERRRQYYEVLARETERLHRLVEDLLDFGRMEAGALQYRLQPLDAAALARSVVAEFQEEVAERGYRVELSENGSGPRVRADPEALRRALWNLLDNAVKYSPECQTVWIEVAREGRRLAIRVRDRGLGISAREQKEIFKKFVRGAASETISMKGTGIGLAMVRHIAASHGGEIRVESEPGRGSTFTLLLPVEE